MVRHSEQVRLLSSADHSSLLHMLNTSEYIYQRFTLEELEHILMSFPSVGFYQGSKLRSFLLSQNVNPPSAWIGGFGVSWSESRSYLNYLDLQRTLLTERIQQLNVRYLHYSGNDIENDWLRAPLIERGFRPFRQLYSYDKFDYTSPTEGNTKVHLRPAEMRDIPALLELEKLCFEQLWCYDVSSLINILYTHPYFVVAEIDDQVIGYQFNALDGNHGYLVRIAVHPNLHGQGVGARLMAEAIRFFKTARSVRIMLNTQEENTHAHQLYEWFGFTRIAQIGFVLRQELPSL